MRGLTNLDDKRAAGCLLCVVGALVCALLLALLRLFGQTTSGLSLQQPAAAQRPTRQARPKCRAAAWVWSVVGAFVVGFAANHTYTEWRKQATQRGELAALGYIAYVRDGDIRIRRADGARDRLLVSGANCRGLAWDHYGSELAFVRQYHAGATESVALYSVSLRSARLTKWTADLPGASEWSCIAWAARVISLAFDYTPAQDDLAARRGALVLVAPYGQGGEVREYAGCYGPRLSANGEVFACRDLPQETWDEGPTVALVRLDPGAGDGLDGAVDGSELLSTRGGAVREYGHLISEVGLSPQGDELCFRVGWVGGGTLWVSDTAVPANPRLVSDMNDIQTAQWHPSGSSIVVHKSRGSTGSEAEESSEGLFLVDVDTGRARQLIAGVRGAGLWLADQCWSYDGEWLLLHDYAEANRDEAVDVPLCLLNVTDRRLVVVKPTEAEGACLQPTPLPPASRCHWVFEAGGTVRKVAR